MCFVRVPRSFTTVPFVASPGASLERASVGSALMASVGSALIIKNNDLRDDQDTGSLRFLLR